MPLKIRHIPSGADYEVADLDAFLRAYKDNPDWTVEVGENLFLNEVYKARLDILPDSALGDQTLVPEPQPPVPVDEPARRRRSRS